VPANTKKNAEEIEGLLKIIPEGELIRHTGIQPDTLRKYRNGYQAVSEHLMQSMRTAAELYKARQKIIELSNAKIDTRREEVREVPLKYVVDDEIQAISGIWKYLEGLSLEVAKRVLELMNRKLSERESQEKPQSQERPKVVEDGAVKVKKMAKEYHN
jgi:hypothetical protein